MKIFSFRAPRPRLMKLFSSNWINAFSCNCFEDCHYFNVTSLAQSNNINCNLNNIVIMSSVEWLDSDGFVCTKEYQK